MLTKQLKMSVLQVFSDMTTQRSPDKTLVLLMNRNVCLVAVHLTNTLL